MSVNQNDLNKLMQMAGSLNNKSEDELIDELAKMIKSGKSGLTPKKAKSMFQVLKPMLGQSQRIKLENVMKKLNL